jgi:antitoxin (DNA-binding transcriptional repressor) of toxin-antitoxin stability system
MTVLDFSLRIRMMAQQVLEISATEFKAKCLGLFKDLEAHRYSKVVITRRGKPIAELTPRDREVPDLFGCMKGSVIIPPGFDLTKPILEDIPEAESGEGRF